MQVRVSRKPSVNAASGRLIVHARFSGRAASGWAIRSMSLSGQSRNIGTGALALWDVRVETGRDGLYTRLVRAAMADSLNRNFKYNVSFDAKRMLEERQPGSFLEFQVAVR